jgi:hypothetical protein
MQATALLGGRRSEGGWGGEPTHGKGTEYSCLHELTRRIHHCVGCPSGADRRTHGCRWRGPGGGPPLGAGALSAENIRKAPETDFEWAWCFGRADLQTQSLKSIFYSVGGLSFLLSLWLKVPLCSSPFVAVTPRPRNFTSTVQPVGGLGCQRPLASSLSRWNCSWLLRAVTKGRPSNAWVAQLSVV